MFPHEILPNDSPTKQMETRCFQNLPHTSRIPKSFDFGSKDTACDPPVFHNGLKSLFLYTFQAAQYFPKDKCHFLVLNLHSLRMNSFWLFYFLSPPVAWMSSNS